MVFPRSIKSSLSVFAWRHFHSVFKTMKKAGDVFIAAKQILIAADPELHLVELLKVGAGETKGGSKL